MGASAAVIPVRIRSGGDGELGMVEGFDVALEMSGASPALGDIVEHVNNGAKRWSTSTR